jgi:NAD(P)-dependent dehydrogenase (short-subunit alcohol dehydrogenase family)
MSTTTPLPLAGKSARVTGAARRIGAEIALTLAQGGAKVVVHYRSRDTEANQTVDAIREMGPMRHGSSRPSAVRVSRSGAIGDRRPCRRAKAHTTTTDGKGW